MRLLSLFTAAACVVLVACGAPEDPTKLTREKAKSLILESEKFRIGHYKSDNSRSCLRKKGFRGSGYSPTEKGAKAGLGWDMIGSRRVQTYNYKSEADLEVTGIKPATMLFGATEQSEYKTALFQPAFSAATEAEVHSCFAVDSNGEMQALLVLYDDGWRVEAVSYGGAMGLLGGM